MAFEAETGNGSETATAYASVQAFKDFAALRVGVTVPEDDAEIERALTSATDWIDANFNTVWLGYQTFAEQALDWPRSGLVDSRGMVRPLGYVPACLVKATCLLAVEALKGALYTNETGTSQVIERTTDVLTTKYNPLKPSEITVQRNFDQIRQTLSPITRGFGALTIER